MFKHAQVGKYKMKKSFVSILAILFLAFSNITPTLSLSNSQVLHASGSIEYLYDTHSTDDNGRLHVSGNNIINEYGQQVQLIGVNYQFICWYWGSYGCPRNAAQYEYMADWGCNVVRLAVQFGYFSEDVLDSLEQQVEWAANNGIYAVLATNYGGGSQHMETWNEADFTNWKSIWTQIATRFSGNTNVLYKIWGEPCGLTASQYQARTRECIDAIRAIDPDVIIIVDGLHYSSWMDIGLNFEQTNPISRDNLIFDISKYYNDDSWGYSTSSLISRFNSYGITWCLNNNRAFWIAEFNYLTDAWGSFPGCPNNGPTWMRNTMEYCNEIGAVGYAAWTWTVKAGDPFYLIQNWYGTPSESGLVLQEGLS